MVCVMRILSQRECNGRNRCIDSNRISLDDKDQHVHIVGCVYERANSAIYDCRVCFRLTAVCVRRIDDNDVGRVLCCCA